MYNLHLPGWRDFQNLAHTILREILGQTVERFLDSKDAGRDSGFAGIWQTSGMEDLSGKYVPADYFPIAAIHVTRCLQSQ
jgi:hypothetical protein